MAGIVANYDFAYGFVISISNKRYFTSKSTTRNMNNVRIRKQWIPFINEVGWTRYCGPEEHSGLFVFGERIRSTEDCNLKYFSQFDDGDVNGEVYDVIDDILLKGIRNKELIDEEARLNDIVPSVLLFLNDRLPQE